MVGPLNAVINKQTNSWEVLKEQIGKPVVNHQKYCIKFKEDGDKVKCDVSLGELTKTDVSIIFEANYFFNKALLTNPRSMTYHLKENTLVIGSYGLPGGAPNQLIKLLESGLKGDQNSFVDAMQLILADKQTKHLINLPNDQGQTPLHIACQINGDTVAPVYIVQLLCNLGASIDVTDANNFTPLYIACINNLPEHVEALLHTDANPNIRCSNGVAPIEVALLNKNIQVIQHLIDYGANLDEVKYTHFQYTPEIRALLESQGVPPTEIDVPVLNPAATLDEGDRILFSQAVKNEPFNELERLIDQEAPCAQLVEWCTKYPNHLSTHGLPNIYRTSYYENWQRDLASPLQLAAKGSHPEFISLLYMSGVGSVNAHPGNEPPIYIACDNRRLENVRVLLQLGANVNAKQRRNPNATALLKAVERGDERIVDLLLRSQANINASNGLLPGVLQGLTVQEKYRLPQGALSILHLALIKKNLPIIRMLVEFGADLSWIGKRTPQNNEIGYGDPYRPHKLEALQFAIEKCDRNIVTLLVSKGAKYLNCTYIVFKGLSEDYQILLLNSQAVSPLITQQVNQESYAYLNGAFQRGDGPALASAANFHLEKGQNNNNPNQVQMALELYQYALHFGAPVQNSITQCRALLGLPT